MEPNDTPTPILDERPRPSLNETDPKIISDRYIVLDKLGEGGMGRVYLALDPVINRQVAIKILRFADRDGELIKRFQLEARAAARLDHYGIVKALDFGLMDDRDPFLVMEYVRGETLDEFLRKEKRLGLEEFQSVFEQVASAMNHAHGKGVVHRDLKPSNILLRRDEDEIKAYVLDFGIARILQDSKSQVHTRTGHVVGSPKYTSPEQISGCPTDVRSDIYSLGCVMFESLTGSVPFQGSNAVETLQMHINNPVPSLGQKISGSSSYSDQIEQLVARCLAKDSNDRYQSMDEVRDALSKLTSVDDTCETALEREPERPAPRSSNSRKAVLLTVFLISISGALLVVVSKNPEPEHSHSVRLEHMPGSVVKPGKILDDVSVGARCFTATIGIPPDSCLHDKNYCFNGLAGIRDSDLDYFRTHYPYAVSLNLSRSMVQGAGLHYLEGMRLSHLDLEGRPLKDSDLASIGKLVRLESLVLSGCKEIDGSGLSSLVGLAKLKVLKMRNCLLTPETLENIGNLSSLEILDLCGSTLENKSDILKVTRCHSLKQLRMAGLSLSATLLKEIKRSLPDCKIEMSAGENEKNQPDEQRYFDEFSGDFLGRLKEREKDLMLLRQGSDGQLFKRIELKLVYGALTPSDLERISKCVKLERLNLAYSNITDSDLHYFANLENLEYVALIGTKVTLPGIEKALSKNKSIGVWRAAFERMDATNSF
ncbi:MAG: protein kinase [Cyanobacteria bacterium HKST-UBA02]|nr:protein kinase [Cyanobacteria bacterium HKST-UBA02]